MAVRLQEIHPSVVHYPIALLPTAIGADLLARVTGSEELGTVGKWLMPFAAGTAALAAVAGLVAQEEVKAEGHGAEMLRTHRTLNQGLVLAGAALAAWRMRSERAHPGYLALGLAAIGAMGYSAYLGGKMVYEHGLGVKPARGLRRGDSPELMPGTLREAGRRTAEDLVAGTRHVIEDVRRGDLLPAVGKRHELGEGAAPAGGRRARGARDAGTKSGTKSSRTTSSTRGRGKGAAGRARDDVGGGNATFGDDVIGEGSIGA